MESKGRIFSQMNFAVGRPEARKVKGHNSLLPRIINISDVEPIL